MSVRPHNHFGEYRTYLFKGQLSRSDLISSKHELRKLIVEAIDDCVVRGFTVFIGFLCRTDFFLINVTVVEFCYSTRKLVTPSGLVLVGSTPPPSELGQDGLVQVYHQPESNSDYHRATSHNIP